MGRFCGDILQCGMCRLHCSLRTAVKGKKTRVSRRNDYSCNKRGKEIPVRINTAGLFADDGHLIGGVESFQNILRLKALEREKDNLISMLAHDMRSAHAIIGGFIRRLLTKSRTINQAKQEEYLQAERSRSGH